MHSPLVNLSKPIHRQASLALPACLFFCTLILSASAPVLHSQSASALLSDSTDLPPTTPPQPVIGKALPLRLGDAISLTLERNQNIQIQKGSVMLTRGQLQAATGAFDPVITGQAQGTYSSTDNNETTDYNTVSQLTGGSTATSGFLSNVQDALSVQLAVQKMFRNGIVFAPQFTYSDSLNKFGNESTDSTSGFLGFSVEIPLGAGLGPNNPSAAAERALALEVAAAVSTLEFTVSQQIYNTVSAYWNCLLNQTNVRISRSNEDSARRLVEITEALIRGYVEPAIQLAQAKANLEQYTAQRIAAEQQQSLASQQLAVAMGFTPMELLNEPLIIDPFPTPQADEVLTTDKIKALIELAISLRCDVRSDKQLVEANRVLVSGAENALLPEIDLILGGGLQQGDNTQSVTGRRTTDSQRGLAAAATLSVSWPIFNNTAKGELVQSQAQLQQARVQASLTESQVASDVITSAKSVILMRNALTEAMASAQDSLTSVKAQQTLFTMGMTSLTEVITTQTNLANAQLTVATYQSNYASAVLGLRYATGTLLPSNSGKGAKKGNYELDLGSLTRLPTP